MEVELIFSAGNIVGESLIWDERKQRLFWVDIVGKTINSLDPKTSEHQIWNTPDFVTSIGLRKDGGALVAFTKDICSWEFDQSFNRLIEVEADQPLNRLNEGVVGPDGAFWIGTMQNNIAADGSAANITESTGRLYRYTPQGEIISLSDDFFGITNTLIWPDRHHLITADTLTNEIYRYDLEQNGEKLANRRPIVAGFERGLPDGSCMDADGFIWNCRVVGGACLLRFSPDGAIDTVVELPCSWPTSCCFGGEALDTLFVTSARFTMEDDHLDAHPQEGGLFALKPGVKGLPTHRFG